MIADSSVKKIVLASASVTRMQLLRNAGLVFEVAPAGIDEDSVKREMRSEGNTALETAQALADKISFSLNCRFIE